MCGIVAYYGKENQVLETLLGGLKRLEYRGYDSSGVAILTKENTVFTEKEAGKIINLENAINLKVLPDFGRIGYAWCPK